MFRDTIGKTASLNTLGQTACMLLPKESVQGRCWEDSVPEHFGPNWLHTTPLHFPLQPKVFRDAAWQATSLNTLGRTTCMQVPKGSVQGSCGEDSVPEHFGPSCLHTSPLHFPPQPKVFRDAAWQATSLNTCRELKSGVSFKAWWGNAKRIQYHQTSYALGGRG